MISGNYKSAGVGLWPVFLVMVYTIPLSIYVVVKVRIQDYEISKSVGHLDKIYNLEKKLKQLMTARYPVDGEALDEDKLTLFRDSDLLQLFEGMSGGSCPYQRSEPIY